MSEDLFDQDPHEATRRELAELRRDLAHANERLDQLMSDFTALDAAVASITTTVAEVEAFVASLNASAGADQPHIAAAADALTGAETTLRAILPPPAPRSVYTFDGDPTTVDTTQWILTAEQTTDVPPKALYDYVLDVNPGDKLGDGVGGVWHLYSGAVVPVAPVA